MALDPKFDPKLAEARPLRRELRRRGRLLPRREAREAGLAAYFARAKNRDKVWVTTKSDKHDPKGFEQTVFRSLEQLQSDYVDMYYLHALKDADYLTTTSPSPSRALKKAGKIRHFGFSCHGGNVAELLHKAAKTPWVESVMFRYNFRQLRQQGAERRHRRRPQGGRRPHRDEDPGLRGRLPRRLEEVREDREVEQAPGGAEGRLGRRADLGRRLAHGHVREAPREHRGGPRPDRPHRRPRRRPSTATRRRRARTPATAATTSAAPPSPANVRIGDTMRYLMYHDAYGEPGKARELFAKLPAEARDALAGRLRPGEPRLPARGRRGGAHEEGGGGPGLSGVPFPSGPAFHGTRRPGLAGAAPPSRTQTRPPAPARGLLSSAPQFGVLLPPSSSPQVAKPYSGGGHLGRPNYSHSKRQREIVKKQKREEKLAKKLEKKSGTPDAATDETGENVETVEPTEAPNPDA